MVPPRELEVVSKLKYVYYYIVAALATLNPFGDFLFSHFRIKKGVGTNANGNWDQEGAIAAKAAKGRKSQQFHAFHLCS